MELDPQLSKQYLQRHDLPQIINNLVLDIAKQQPVDPFQYMITCLEKAHAQKQSHAQESIDHQRNRPGNQSSPEAPIRDIPVYNAPTEGVLLTTGSGSEGSASEPPCAPRRFCMADVATHCTRDDCWIVVAGKVYDVTDWLPDHPGGDGMILQLAGHDASLEFAKFHSSYACELLPHYYKGELDATLQPPPRPPRSINASPAHLGGGMLTNQYRGFPLVEVRPQSSNVRVFRFATLAPDEALSLPLVSSVTVCVRDADGGEHEQSYCPIASGKGWFDVLVKRYPADVVSGAIHKLCIGAKLECKGPSPSPVQFDLDQYAELGLLAAGAGVAPMLQIIDALMKAPKCLLQVVSDRATVCLASAVPLCRS